MSRQTMNPSRSPRPYPSLSSFYLDDRRRVDSREIDVGLWWRDGSDGALHRAAWIEDTGELYLVRLGPEREGGGAVEVLAAEAEHDEVDRVLAGWRDECGTADSLAWLRRRAAVLRRRARRAQLELAAAAGAAVALMSTAMLVAADLG